MVELDALLLKEVLDGRLGHRAVVCEPVRLQPPLHVLQAVVRAQQLLLGEVADALDEVGVAALEHENAPGEDALVPHVLVEGGFLALGQLLLVLFDRIAVLVQLDHFLQENVLGVLKRPREAVEDVAAVPAVVLAELELEHFPEEVVGHADCLLYTSPSPRD